jgi:hypothetical protein
MNFTSETVQPIPLTGAAIIEETRKLSKALQPIASRHNYFSFDPRTTSSTLTSTMTALPFVFVMGTSSSGKSSFINHVLNRQVQTTFDPETTVPGGDEEQDGFTIIAPGDMANENDITGQALVRDEDLGFNELLRFGPTLVSNTTLKIRNSSATEFMIVDTPSITDEGHPRWSNTNSSTRNKGSNNSNNSSPSKQKKNGFKDGSNSNTCPYDAEAAFRWYVKKADVVLLFLEPQSAELSNG